MLSVTDYVVIGLAALAAGLVNAIAGGGTLITFPVLTAVGVPAVAANITNAVALCPGFLGAVYAQRRDLDGQERRLRIVLPASAVGGIVGGILLVIGGERVFRSLIPFLILGASALLAAQDRLRAWLARRPWHRTTGHGSDMRVAVPLALGAVYGGYFGAGLSVIMLAVLGLMLDDSLTRLNALKSALGLVINVAAALFFVFSGQVVWTAAAVMAAGALLGGVVGGKVAGMIAPSTLRWTVVAIGAVVGLIYLVT
ncbi:MAG: sulfite exporter TauE/SafE family protein [Acidobacteria bacterium]|nr:sulfite exporter TauE/SafE family protein [Acidobacteriota bacterium]